MADCCPDLEYLQIQNCAAALARLAQCSKMKRIFVNDSAHISDNTLVSLARAWPLLTSISLFGTNIGDASISALCQHCPLLTTLAFGKCSNITDAAINTVTATWCALVTARRFNARNNQL